MNGQQQTTPRTREAILSEFSGLCDTIKGTYGVEIRPPKGVHTKQHPHDALVSIATVDNSGLYQQNEGYRRMADDAIALARQLGGI